MHSIIIKQRHVAKLIVFQHGIERNIAGKVALHAAVNNNIVALVVLKLHGSSSEWILIGQCSVINFLQVACYIGKDIYYMLGNGHGNIYIRIKMNRVSKIFFKGNVCSYL